jgi:hypothetical protein
MGIGSEPDSNRPGTRSEIGIDRDLVRAFISGNSSNGSPDSAPDAGVIREIPHRPGDGRSVVSAGETLRGLNAIQTRALSVFRHNSVIGNNDGVRDGQHRNGTVVGCDNRGNYAVKNVGRRSETSDIVNQHDINCRHRRHRESNAVRARFTAGDDGRGNPHVLNYRGYGIEVCWWTSDYEGSGFDVPNNLKRSREHAGAVNVDERLRDSTPEPHARTGRNDDDSDR